MKKILLYGMTGEKSCFLHVLLNAAQLSEGGYEVKVIFEGASVKLVKVFEGEKNSVYLKVKAAGLIAGICLACSKTLGVYEDNLASGLPMLSDMNGHAGMKPFFAEGYEVISI
jgi:intracellular sulfur oxidation DsrE/DsrF family protein